MTGTNEPLTLDRKLTTRVHRMIRERLAIDTYQQQTIDMAQQLLAIADAIDKGNRTIEEGLVAVLRRSIEKTFNKELPEGTAPVRDSVIRMAGRLLCAGEIGDIPRNQLCRFLELVGSMRPPRRAHESGSEACASP